MPLGNKEKGEDEGGGCTFRNILRVENIILIQR
jgi:hypothetical protein